MQYKYDHKVMECITAKVAKQVRGPSLTFCLFFPIEINTKHRHLVFQKKYPEFMDNVAWC